MTVRQLLKRDEPETPDSQQAAVEIIEDPVAAAKAAGLRYVTDTRPGIRRERVGDDFQYIGVDGQPITDPATLDRINGLGIPPAYTDVWICPIKNGHLQATGRDARGRKQYRYHARWRATRDENKYGRMLLFGEALPRIRERVAEDLALPGMPREKVLATVVRLLETTMIRVGNEEYARQNDSYGLTTMRNEHVDVQGSTVRFQFRGKSGKHHEITLRDRRLARIVKRSQELPGHELFEYVDADGNPHTISSDDVNAYLQEITGEHFTAKDFRTWAGTLLCALCLKETETAESETAAKKNIVAAIKSVSDRLGNTPAVCRKCYVHPVVIDSYLEGTMIEALGQHVAEETQDDPHALNAEEAAVLSFLHRNLAQTAEDSPRKAA